MDRFAPNVQDFFGSSGSNVVDLHGAAIAEAPTKVANLNGLKIALIGSYSPRRCGIATFTADVEAALLEHLDHIAVDVWPVRTRAELGDLDCQRSLIEGDPDSFRGAARQIEESRADVALLQHEFGLFGGKAGDCVLALVDALTVPLVVTLHTVLENPDPDQRRVMDQLVRKASKFIVMTEASRALLSRVYRVDPANIALVEHGVPDRQFGKSHVHKDTFGLTGPTLLTFGLLSPGKGIEHAISAMPDIVAAHPDAVYCIAGATHPNLVSREGESYRNSLKALAQRLGVEKNIRWIDRFLEQGELLDLIDAADIYLTPYPGAAQSTSGTLSYAVALGKAVISTPYVHACDLLANDVGQLVPFGDAKAIALAVNILLDNPEALAAMQLRAYSRGREMIWSNYAAKIAGIANEVRRDPHFVTCFDPAPLALDGLLAMCDQTGIVQHSCRVVPERKHGYCVDDNARALILANRIGGELGNLTLSFAAFVNHAWNESDNSFRNFMSYSGEWLETRGSPDSNGRSLWALALTSVEAQDCELREWAADLYRRSRHVADEFHSPRAIAFGMLAACAYLQEHPDECNAMATLRRGAVELGRLFDACAHTGWHWFEDRLAYDNARLSEAMIRAGLLLGDDRAAAQGLMSLTWLDAVQTSASGHFRPVGSDSFGDANKRPLPFDQQPIEAWAMIDACTAAYAADCRAIWLESAFKAYNWFEGANDLGVAVGSRETGRCFDGLTPQGVNKNSGAESLLAYHLAHHAMVALTQKDARDSARIR